MISYNSQHLPLNKLNYIMTICIKKRLRYLQCFVRKLLVGPLLEFDVYGGVKGAGVHCLGSR